MKPKIFIYRPHDQRRDCAAVAYAADGEELGFHVSSDYCFFRNDMGLNGEVGMGSSKHEIYRKKYPDGYELVECIGSQALQEHISSGALKGVVFDSPATSV